MVPADAADAPQAAFRAGPPGLFGQLPRLTAALCEGDQFALPGQELLLGAGVVRYFKDPGPLRGPSRETPEVRPVRRGPGPPPRLDDRRGRADGPRRRLVRLHRDELW